ncbi:MAG: hypothetical protein HYY20_10040 [Candidatus Tectomicrobia bacterium]|uniref:Toxin-antitoxin system toxin component, PIN family n=1 Tax=Tectimicrobiota bacterium TaxID=2528274 RepID=A0A932G1F5_UNCTE|nr:hypothetical protein [Candidatus Tectomicrobia bacterium]
MEKDKPLLHGSPLTAEGPRPLQPGCVAARRTSSGSSAGSFPEVREEVGCNPLILLGQKASESLFRNNSDLQRASDYVEITGDLHVVADDPDDDKFVECAMVAGASRIVSGDQHLLALGQYEGIHILSAAEFITHFTRLEGSA